MKCNEWTVQKHLKFEIEVGNNIHFIFNSNFTSQFEHLQIELEAVESSAQHSSANYE